MCCLLLSGVQCWAENKISGVTVLLQRAMCSESVKKPVVT